MVCERGIELKYNFTQKQRPAQRAGLCILQQVFVVNGAGAADEAGTGAGGEYRCLADGVVFKAEGDGDLFQVHSDEGEADVKTRVGLDLLHDNGVTEAFVRLGGKGTACLGLRYNVHGLGKGYGSALGNDGAVKVLAALDGEEQTLAFGVIVESLEYFPGNGEIGIGADFRANDLAGGAADNDDAAFFKRCLLAKLGHGGLCLFIDSVHSYNLISCFDLSIL